MIGKTLTWSANRVTPEAGGEAFLGRQKDVDAGYVVEALMIAAAQFSNSDYAGAARRVIAFYQMRIR